MADDRQELIELRRIDELERKASGGKSVDKKFTPDAPKESGSFDTLKDIGVGLGTSIAEPVLGVGELVPGPIGRASARGTQAVEKAYQESANRSPIATRAGYIPGVLATSLVPGGAAFKATEGAGLLARALGTGAGAGLGAFALTPTGKENYGERMGEKGTSAAITSALGAALPVAGAAGKFIKNKTPDFVTRLTGKQAKAYGKEAEDLAQKVKSQTSAGVAERQAAEEQSAKEASARAKELESPQNKELQAQKDISQAKSSVSQKLIADKTQAKKSTDEALNKLSAKPASEEDVGGLIQPLGRKNVKELSKARQETAITKIKDPAFDRARARESAGQYIETDPESQGHLQSAFDELETQINRTTEPYQSQLKARLQSLKGKEIPLSQSELRVEKLRESSLPGYVAKTSKREPMTTDQAEFMRRMLTDKKLSEETGFAALDVANRTKVATRITEAMKKFEQGVGEYLTKYQETSAPITKALTGRGGQLTEAQQLAEEEVLFSADKSATAKYYLDGSQERAQRLVDLVGGKPKELVDSIGGFVRGKMENMTAAQAEQFTKQGLFNVFPEIKEAANQVLKSKQAEEKVSSLLSKQGAIGATGATGRLGKALGTEATLGQKLTQSAKSAATTAEKAQESAKKFEAFNTYLNTLSPEESLGQSKKFLNEMSNRIPKEDYERSLLEIQNAEQAYKKYKDAADLTRRLRRAVTYKVVGATVGGGTAYYLTH